MKEKVVSLTEDSLAMFSSGSKDAGKENSMRKIAFT